MRFQDWDRFSRQLLIARAMVQFGLAMRHFAHERGLEWYTCDSCGKSSPPRTFNLWAVNNLALYYHWNCDTMCSYSILETKSKVNQCNP